MPFAGFKNQAECEAKNRDKNDPGAYCATIRRSVEGKSADYEKAFAKALEGEDTGWLDTKEWHNDRIKSAFVNDALEDYEGDRVTLEAQVLAMPAHLERGFLEWMHGRDDRDPADESKKGPPIKIGEPVGWRVKDQKVELRWGVYGREDMGGFRENDDISKWIDQRWERMNQGGTVSMTFLPIEVRLVQEDGHTVREISLIHLQSVGYVKELAASPGAVITAASTATDMALPALPGAAGLALSRPLQIVMKAVDPAGVSRETALTDQAIKEFLGKMEKQAQDPGAVCGQLWFNGTETQREAFSGGTAGRGRDEAPPKAWMDDCIAHVSKMQTLKTASKYAPPEGRPMVDPVENPGAPPAGAPPEPAPAPAPAPAPVEKQPPEGGCPEGQEWDPDQGECVDKEPVEGASISRKEFDELKKGITEIRNLQMNRIQNLPDPGKMKALREAVAKKLVDDEVPDETGTAILAALDAALPEAVPTPVEMSFDERVKSMVEGIVDVQMTSVTQAQEKAWNDYEGKIREELHIPVQKSRVKPALTGAGALSLSPEKAAERLTKKARESTKKRLTGVRGGL